MSDPANNIGNLIVAADERVVKWQRHLGTDMAGSASSSVVELSRSILRGAEAAAAFARQAPIVVNATGDDHWTLTAPGVGTPELITLYFDHDQPLDDIEANLREYERAYNLLTERGAYTGVMAEGIASEREYIDQNRQWEASDKVFAGTDLGMTWAEATGVDEGPGFTQPVEDR